MNHVENKISALLGPDIIAISVYIIDSIPFLQKLKQMYLLLEVLYLFNLLILETLRGCLIKKTSIFFPLMSHGKQSAQLNRHVIDEEEATSILFLAQLG